jgi:hypothetical protein
LIHVTCARADYVIGCEEHSNLIRRPLMFHVHSIYVRTVNALLVVKRQITVHER